MTKYEEIARVLRDRINEGIYPEHSLLPNQHELVEEFQVSRMTIKKAINILITEGLIYSQRGAGTRVLEKSSMKNTSPADEFNGLTAVMKGKNLTNQVIEFNVCFPDEVVQAKLKVQPQQPVYHIIRLRLLDGKPFVIEQSYLPTDLVPDLTSEVLRGSLYSYIHEELNIQFAGAYRTIRADIANELDMKHLGCDKITPILEIEQIIYLKDSRPIEYSCNRNTYDTRSYTILDVHN